MRLIDDADKLWSKFWSVRFSLAAFAAGIYAGWDAYLNGHSPWICFVTAALAFLAGVSRVIAQPKARDGLNG